MEKPFQIGDLVSLKGQQVAMTIIHVGEETCHCAWYNMTKNLEVEELHMESIERVWISKRK